MKNSLQLQLQIRIRKANKYLISRQYQKAIQQYSATLQNYLQNRRYNSSVSEHFQSLLYSLRANAHSLNLQSEAAEQDFQKSLNLNPYNSITLSKRAQHFIKLKKLQQAIQDIDTALLYDPNNISLVALLDTILEYSKQLNDKETQSHIKQLIQSVKKHLQVKVEDKNITSSQSEQDEEQFLNFSNLKKIDRVSVKVNALKISKRKSIVQFKQDQIVQYEENVPKQKEQVKPIQNQNIQKKLMEQELQLKKLQDEQQKQKMQQQFVIVKVHEKSRKSILRRESVFGDQKGNHFLSFTSPGHKVDQNNSSNKVLKSNTSQQNKSVSSFSRLSVKNIDGKFISHQPQNIKFQHSLSSFGFINNSQKSNIQNNQDSNQKYSLTLTQPKVQKRKSCFRVSKRFSIDQSEQLSKTMPLRKKSSFLNIKSIDGQYHKKKQNVEGDEQQEPIQIKISSDSDDENEHDIFGNKKDKQLINLINSVNGKSNKNASFQQSQSQKKEKTLQLSKKKSILKKESFLDSPFEGWKSQKKKSVLFKTG